MKATTSIDRTEITHNPEGTLNAHGDTDTLQDRDARARAGQETAHRGKPESELRAAARRHGLTLKELAQLMGVSYNYLSQVSGGRRPWTPMLRERAMAVLGEVPGTGIVYRQGGVIQGGESSYIRERAREKGLSMGELADLVGLSRGYLTQASRGERCLSPSAQARVENVLEAPVKVEPAQFPYRGPSCPVGANGCSRLESKRGGPAGGHQCLLSLPDHERPAHPIGTRAAAPARRPVRADCTGTGGPGGTQGDGLEERRAQRRGGQGRRRTGLGQHPHRRAGALGRRGGVRLYCYRR